MLTKATSHGHVEMGNYAELKNNHLIRKDEMENKDIFKEYTHLNKNEVLFDIAAFKKEHQEKATHEYNKKLRSQGNSKRIVGAGTYEDLVERDKSHAKRKKDKPFGTERLFVCGYSDTSGTEQLIEDFAKMGFKKEEVLEAMGRGLSNHAKVFNERFQHLAIAETFTNVDEGYAHVHEHLIAYGKEQSGRPFTDINHALKAEFGKTRVAEDGKVLKMDNRTLWRTFRDKNDRIINECVNAELKNLAATKDIDYTPPEFYRSGTEYTGLEHDKRKEAVKTTNELVKAEKERMQKELDAFELEIKTKKTSLKRSLAGTKAKLIVENKKLMETSQLSKEFEEQQRKQLEAFRIQMDLEEKSYEKMKAEKEKIEKEKERIESEKNRELEALERIKDEKQQMKESLRYEVTTELKEELLTNDTFKDMMRENILQEVRTDIEKEKQVLLNSRYIKLYTANIIKAEHPEIYDSALKSANLIIKTKAPGSNLDKEQKAYDKWLNEERGLDTQKKQQNKNIQQRSRGFEK